ncbi:PTS sugar transporter subunit IIA [Alkalicoccobacillus plakortidis]|uniref:PTS glucose transporter subunit IIA n=1 Tax=Alkalicoccobacillus plakortidis TaxID=444060 RepID=A0ABT0XEH1_9BACI|nr:PTS glucose transporter subunit IIA [Alkalicoccobacillus plakortidis]MCM2674205.1 PTS glucose transporter subunit IIA [Alkalicoccobacillus plakortidis]
MFKKLFGLDKKEEQETHAKPTEEIIFSVANGTLLPIDQVPDPTFSQKMIGDGAAIEPTDGKVVSPVAGEVLQVFPTKHAIGIRAIGGAEILIHIGLETVNMDGEGFTAHVKEGDKVEVGDALVDYDLELVKEKAASTIIPIVVTNHEELESVTSVTTGDSQAGTTTHLTVKYKR